MLPLVLGGVALAATGYGLKKFFEDDDNREKLTDSLMRQYDWIDEADRKTQNFFDKLQDKVENFFDGNPKNIEVELNDEDELLPEVREAIEILQTAQYELYRTSYRELQTAINELKNFGRDLDDILYFGGTNRYNFTAMSEEVKQEIVKFAEILTMTKKYIDANLDKLDILIVSSNDFTTYGAEDKEFVLKLETLNHTINVATQSNMTLDGENITREVKRAFGKLQTMIEVDKQSEE